MSKISCLAAALALPVAGLLMASPEAAAHHNIAEIVKRLRPVVVHIQTQTFHGRPKAERKFLKPFQFPDRGLGMGTGMIVSPDGLILTNHHVIEGADVIDVTLSTGAKLKARVIGMDSHTDLALIKIAAEGLKQVTFGDSGTVQVGDWVVAIGSPLGLEHTVTVGIISAKGRNIFDSENVAYGEFLQTDAAINPGNSGGPLFDLEGRVIGINTAISSKGQGIGCAVPSNLARQVMRQLRDHGRVIRGWLGVVIQEVTFDLSKSMALPSQKRGVLVDDILRGAPAEIGGIRKGDVLVVYGEIELTKVTQLQRLVAFTPPGRKITIHALRRKGNCSRWKTVKLAVVIGNPPNQESVAGASLFQLLGISLREPPETARREIGLEAGVGVLVKQVSPGSRAAETGLREGDIILEADRRRVGNPEALQKILAQNRNSRISLLIKRNKKVLFLVLDLPK